mmetsp:Transcript_16375/g.46728  ORF Transcript_16375/g.46728 Transcript_16375/m.46728 type:complete len:248 (-) Transcript_16375:690-1433(-)
MLQSEEPLCRIDALLVEEGAEFSVPEIQAQPTVPLGDVLTLPCLNEGLVVADALELIQPDLPRRGVAVGAVAPAGRRASARASRLRRRAGAVVPVVLPGRAGPREAVPHRVCIVVGPPPLVRWEIAHIVAADEVAILGKLIAAVPRASAFPAVEGIADAKVHPRVQQGLRSLRLHLHADNASDTKLAGGLYDHLIVQIPHNASQVCSIHILRWIVCIAHCSVHVEGQDWSFAGKCQCMYLWEVAVCT